MSAVRDHQLPTSSTSGTDESEEDMDGHRCKLPGHAFGVRKLVVFSALFAAFTVAAAVWMKRRGRDSTFLAGVVSKATSEVPPEYKTFYEKVAGTSCSNKNSLESGTMIATLDECHTACAETDACSAFNYQDSDCGAVDAVGTCILYIGECEQTADACRSLYLMSAYYENPRWTMTADNTGCDNWQAIMTSLTKELNENACGQKCATTSGCIEFNWQEKNCRAIHPEERLGTDYDGACMLFRGGCIAGANTCWKHFELRASARRPFSGLYLTQSASAGSTSLVSNYITGLEVGQQITISSMNPNYFEKATVKSLGPLQLEGGLTNMFPRYSMIRPTCSVVDGSGASSAYPCGCAHQECANAEVCDEANERCLTAPVEPAAPPEPAAPGETATSVTATTVTETTTTSPCKPDEWVIFKAIDKTPTGTPVGQLVVAPYFCDWDNTPHEVIDGPRTVLKCPGLEDVQIIELCDKSGGWNRVTIVNQDMRHMFHTEPGTDDPNFGPHPLHLPAWAGGVNPTHDDICNTHRDKGGFWNWVSTDGIADPATIPALPTIPYCDLKLKAGLQFDTTHKICDPAPESCTG